MCKFEYEILAECAGLRAQRLWGAAVGAALEHLRGMQYITRAGEITDAGRKALAERKPNS